MGSRYTQLALLSILLVGCSLVAVACRQKLSGNSTAQLVSSTRTPAKPKSAKTDPARLYEGELQVGGHKRTYHFYLPSSTKTKGALPVILAFHGWGGTGKDMMEMSQLNRAADKKGAIVVYPDGFQNTWADGRGYTPSDKAGIDDVGFTRALLAKLAERQNIDRSRIYAVGFSNGGHFAQRLGCDLADAIAGIAVVASDFPVKVAERCQPKRPISAIIIHGSEDQMSPADGETEPGQEALSIYDTVKKWSSLSGCSMLPVTKPMSDLASEGLKLDRTTYSQCRSNTQVVFYDIQGGGHTWPGGNLPEQIFGKTAHNFDATSAIYHFFLG